MLPARRLGFAALLSTLVLTAPAPAEDSPLAQVPAQAPIVFHFRGYGRIKERIVTLAKNAAPDLAPLAEGQVDRAMGKVLEGRDLKALPPDGSIFFAFLEVPQQGEKEPMAAVIARVTSYNAFRDGVLKEDERKTLKKEDGFEVVTSENGNQVYFLDRKEYAVITPRKEVVERLSKKSDQTLASKLDKDDARRLMEPDVGVYVDVAAINKVYGPVIQQFRQQMEGFIDQMGPLFGKGNEGLIEIAKVFYGAMFQVQEDSQTVLLSLDFQPQGLAVHVQARVGADSKTGRTLKTFHRDDFKSLARMPTHQLIYAGMDVDGKAWQQFMPWMYGVMGGKDSSEDMKAALKELADVKPQSSVMASNIPIGGLAVWQYADPARAADAQLKLLQSFGSGSSFSMMQFKDKPEIKANERTYRDFKLNFAKFTWDLDKMAERIPGGGERALESMKKMMGEAISTWFGTDGKRYVQVTAKDWAQAKHILDAYLDGKNTIGAAPAYAEVRKHLPAQSTLLVLIDLPRYVGSIMSMFRGQDTEAPAPSGKPTYLGLAVTLRPELGSLEIWVPASAVGEVRKALPGGGGQ
jgi:hypothetical protein